MYVIHDNSRNLHMFARSCSFCIAEKENQRRWEMKRKEIRLAREIKAREVKAKERKSETKFIIGNATG